MDEKRNWRKGKKNHLYISATRKKNKATHLKAYWSQRKKTIPKQNNVNEELENQSLSRIHCSHQALIENEITSGVHEESYPAKKKIKLDSCIYQVPEGRDSRSHLGSQGVNKAQEISSRENDTSDEENNYSVANVLHNEDGQCM
ncbi:uncharacterized protein LOC134536025 [Bacillus rossius redtenbacheri]|uniref:uncharacterized protein LOC134536025 n=1 Tax=Bacillus rossius redtenbacheri TaxID=93214 RepID=UPI002FDCEE4B